MSTTKKLICLIMALVLSLALVGCDKSGSESSNVANSNNEDNLSSSSLSLSEFPEENTSPAPSLNLVEFNEALYNNELAAEEKYFGNRYRVSSEVDSISKEGVYAGHFIPCSRVGGGKEYIDFLLKYRNDQKDYLLGLSEGDRIIFEGTLVGFYGIYVYFEDVIFIH